VLAESIWVLRPDRVKLIDGAVERNARAARNDPLLEMKTRNSL
jgi:hypothetical protein